MTQSNEGNGKHNPQIEKFFEPLEDDTQNPRDRWVEKNSEDEYQITFSNELREELGIEDPQNPDN
jgi:hypothetical protein